MNFTRKYCDIAANLTDAMYQGIYNGKAKHPPDLNNVIQRALDSGVARMIITGTDLDDSKHAIDIANNYTSSIFCTVGVHPTRCMEFGKDDGDWKVYLSKLETLAEKNRGVVVAIGECGLDYDRLHFCDKEVQKKYFKKQLDLAAEVRLPLFLHCRNAGDDFIRIIKEVDRSLEGVVHSFDGSKEHMKELVDMGYYIGLNGCSLKTEENLDVVRDIPTDKILIETDCPWCEIRPTHASFKHVKTHRHASKKEKWSSTQMIKGRNEPCNILQVLEVIAAVRDQNMDGLAEQILSNTENLFF